MDHYTEKVRCDCGNMAGVLIETDWETIFWCKTCGAVCFRRFDDKKLIWKTPKTNN